MTGKPCGSCWAARRDLTLTRTAQINRLRALLLGGDDGDRALARGSLTQARLAPIARRRGRPTDTVEQQIRARRSPAGWPEPSARPPPPSHRTGSSSPPSSTALAPELIDATGVGPVSAAQALVSWSHRGRCRNDAAFAALAGACPIPASSGRVTLKRPGVSGD